MEYVNILFIIVLHEASFSRFIISIIEIIIRIKNHVIYVCFFLFESSILSMAVLSRLNNAVRNVSVVSLIFPLVHASCKSNASQCFFSRPKIQDLIFLGNICVISLMTTMDRTFQVISSADRSTEKNIKDLFFVFLCWWTKLDTFTQLLSQKWLYLIPMYLIRMDYYVEFVSNFA